MQQIPGNSIGVLEIFFSEGSSSIDDTDGLESKIDLYPNPSKGLVNLTLRTAFTDDVQLKLIDISGWEVMLLNRKIEKGPNSFLLNISEFNDGVYFIMVKTSSGVVVKKIVVSK